MAGDKQSQQANQTSTSVTSTVDSRQVNTADSNNTYTVDGGAILGALDLAKSVAAGANGTTAAGYDFAGRTLDSALDFAGANDSKTLDLVSSALATVTKQSGTVIDQLQGAYADATGTSDSQKQIILGLLAVVGIIAFSAFKGRA